tara:strand:- start:114 stop:590 length:477 start_codon:yes stop_codon:yes gene_type:complete
MKKLLGIVVLALVYCSIGIAEIIHLKCDQQSRGGSTPNVFMTIDFENNKVGFNRGSLPTKLGYDIYQMDDYKIYLQGENYSESISANTETYGQVMGTVTYLEKLIIDRTVGRVDSDMRNWPWEVIEATGNATDGRAIYGRSSKHELENCEIFKAESKF